MKTENNFCRLCLSECEDHKSLFDRNGQCTRIYELMDKYFETKLLNLEVEKLHTVLCMVCWRQIFDFHNFQQFVYEAQERFNVILHVNKPQLNGDDGSIEDTEFLPMEKSLSTTVEQQQSRQGIRNDKGQYVSSPQLENVDVISIADSDESDYLEQCALNGDDFNNQNTLLADVNELTKTLESNAENERERVNGFVPEMVESNCEAILDVSLAQLINTVDETKTNQISLTTNSKDEDNINSLLNDADDDTIIAQWKPSIKCQLCSKNCSTFTLLRKHFREKHPLCVFYVVCCRHKFYYRCTFADHIRRHLTPHPYKCKFCDRGYARYPSLIAHLQTHQTPNANTQMEATRKPKSRKLFKANSHNKVIDEDDAFIAQWKPSLKCEICDKTYLSFTSLRKHFRQKHPQDTFYIECCERKFKYRCTLTEHIHNHMNPNPFKCTYCSKGYSQKANLTTHMRKRHYHRQESSDKKLNVLIEKWKEELECSHCCKTFSTIKLLRHHFRYMHPKMYFHVLCCGLKLRRRLEIEAHIRSHLRSKFKCEQCNKCFTAPSTLYRHKLNTHKGRKKCKQLKADVSAEHYKENVDIDNPKELLEEKVFDQWKPNLKCTACSTTLATYTDLQEHYSKEHPNDKCNFVCCGRNLTESSEIEDHMRLHCSVETYTCTLCDECFLSGKDLNYHKQRKHRQWKNSIG